MVGRLVSRAGKAIGTGILFPLLERILSEEELAKLADRSESARSEDVPEPWSGISYGPFPGPGDSDGG